MAIPHIGGLSDKVVSVRHSDVSRAASTYLAAPRKGKIVRAHAALEAATTGASTLTLKINGNDVTSGSLTLGITAGTTTSLDLIDASPCTDDSNHAGKPDEEFFEYKTEYDVLTGLRDLGHEVHPLGLYDDLTPPAPGHPELQTPHRL
jgi:hypothetical protein